MKFDYLIVGAGFSGLVMAERLSSQLGKTSLVVDKRYHIGGNCYDEYDSNGILNHKYGPHYFRTNSTRIKNYLSQFTNWHKVNYKILSYTNNEYWSFPINLKTFEQFLGRTSSEDEFSAYLLKKRVCIKNPKNSEEVIISQVGWEFYEKFFKNYTIKQWKLHPKDLDPSVCGRIPIRTNRNDSYFNDDFQALPINGYNKLFQSMLSASHNATVLLNTDYTDVMHNVEYKHLIYTGQIDEYYDRCYGSLPYRSLRFEKIDIAEEQLLQSGKIHSKNGFYQPAVQINYPNDELYTRIVEAKHVTGQICKNTCIIREYPAEYNPGGEAYYPIPTDEATDLYKKYKERADLDKNVTFIGRLGTYKYYNMDQIIGMALTTFDKIKLS